MNTTKNQRKLIQFSKKIRTIGINGLNLERFIDTLKKMVEQNNIKIFSDGQDHLCKLGDILVVVDIRQSVICKAKEGFSPNNLKTELEKNGMEYLRYNTLGNPRYKEKDNKEVTPGVIKNAYLDHIKIGPAQEAFINLFKRIDTKRPHKIYCLLCYCRDYALCHRAWLKEALINIKRTQLGLEPDYTIQIPEIIIKKV